MHQSSISNFSDNISHTFKTCQSCIKKHKLGDQVNMGAGKLAKKAKQNFNQSHALNQQN
jgi:hypothetical protein